MKNQNPMHALLAAFVLLVGISSTDAALCSASAFKVASLPTCDCPVGTGPSGSFDSALPPKVGGYGAGAAATGANQLIAANAALKLCVDLLPGYTTVTGVALPTLCAQTGATGSYCSGFPDLYLHSGTAGEFVFPAGGKDSTGYGVAVLGASFTVAASNDAAKDIIIRACPANSLSSGSTGLMTMERCKVTAGYYVAAILAPGTPGPTTGVRTISQSPAGKTATPDCSAADTTSTCAAVTCIGGGNTAGALGGFICPSGTYGFMGSTIALSIAALTGETKCAAGTTPDNDADLCAVTLDGYYGSPGNVLSCPTGVTGSAALDLTAACTDVAPGYYVPTAIPRQSMSGNLDALVAGILPCPINKYCAGSTSAIAITGLSQSVTTYAAVAASTGAALPKACPDGIGNAQTVSAQGLNAVSVGTACVDLLPGYAFKPGASGTDLIGNTKLLKCSDSTVGEYGCAGSANLFVDYTAATKTIAAGTGLSPAANTALTTQLVLTGAVGSEALTATMTVAAAGAGSLVLSPCPVGSTNTVDGSTISDCLLIPGYYIDESNLLVPAICPLGEYCVGGGPVGTAGGASTCPNGSVGRATSGVINSAIGDCTVSKGFYIATSTLNTPVPCPTATACDGGGAVGIAGGSVACPTGSTNAQCSGGGASTTVNLTPASQPITNTIPAAPAPAVTVTNTVPSASSAASTVASMVVVTVAAMVAL